MKKPTIVLTIGLLFLTGLSAVTWALFRGYFDNGKFEVKKTVWSPDRRKLAIVAYRWDNQALGGLDYFVILSDHQFSAEQLRMIYHSDEPVFSAGAPCLSVRWRGPSELEVFCDNPSRTIESDHINAMKQDSHGIRITYKDIPHD